MSYITVADIRAESTPTSPIETATDAFLQSRIDIACANIDNYTGRFFEPRRLTVLVDGRDAHSLILGDPIIEIEEVALSQEFPDDDSFFVLDTSEWVAYDRHIRLGLLNPDDRESPRIDIQLYSATYRILNYGDSFGYGDQNVRVKGIFGYTDPVAGKIRAGSAETYAVSPGDTLDLRFDGAVDSAGDPVILTVTFGAGDIATPGAATAQELATAINRIIRRSGRATVTYDEFLEIASLSIGAASTVEITGGTAAAALAFPSGAIGEPWGVTPALIKRAALLMVMYDLSELGDFDRDNEVNSHRVTSFKTRDQSVTFGRSTSGTMSHQDVGMFTGVPEIDNILAQYVRPADVGFIGGVDHESVSRYRDFGDTQWDRYDRWGHWR